MSSPYSPATTAVYVLAKSSIDGKILTSTLSHTRCHQVDADVEFKLRSWISPAYPFFMMTRHLSSNTQIYFGVSRHYPSCSIKDVTRVNKSWTWLTWQAQLAVNVRVVHGFKFWITMSTQYLCSMFQTWQNSRYEKVLFELVIVVKRLAWFQHAALPGHESDCKSQITSIHPRFGARTESSAKHYAHLLARGSHKFRAIQLKSKNDEPHAVSIVKLGKFLNINI